MGFSSWLDSKLGRFKKEVVESVEYPEDVKITFGGTAKDKECERSYFIEKWDSNLKVMILRNTKKVTSSTKYWTFKESDRQIKTLKTGRIILEDINKTTLQD